MGNFVPVTPPLRRASSPFPTRFVSRAERLPEVDAQLIEPSPGEVEQAPENLDDRSKRVGLAGDPEFMELYRDAKRGNLRQPVFHLIGVRYLGWTW